MRKIAINLFVVAILSHWSILAKSSEPLLYSDTLDIHHIFDGHVYEWPESSFSTDKETSIKYAIHNDNEFLFIALIAKEMGSQMKMSKFGMNLYIDTKGKKKESNGLEFPIKSGLTFSNTRAEEKPTGLISEKERITRLRESMLNSLMFMNIFGFSNTGPEPVSQALKLENKINIAFSWDSLNALIIEYRIPLSVIEESGSLNKKVISIGWKLKGIEIPSGGVGQGGGIGGASGGRPSRGGGRPPGGGARSGGGGDFDRNKMDKMMQEQNIWTKYLITIKDAKKAF